LFLGKCGGLKRKNQIGDLILPIAAIRGEGTSNDYLPPEVPVSRDENVSAMERRRYAQGRRITRATLRRVQVKA
jgi:uridine phosphorylase